MRIGRLPAVLTRRLRTAGVAASVADDLVARFPAQQVADALEVLPARTCSNAAGWLVAAISDGWQLHDEAQRLRATRTHVPHREAASNALQAREEQCDQRLAGWAAALCEALTDTQLTDAVQRITRPVEGLDRRSAPVAASQLLAWRSPPRPQRPTRHSSGAHPRATRPPSDPDIAVVELPDAIPPAPATNTEADPEAFRRRVRDATDDLNSEPAPRQPKLEGGSDAP